MEATIFTETHVTTVIWLLFVLIVLRRVVDITSTAIVARYGIGVANLPEPEPIEEVDLTDLIDEDHITHVIDDDDREVVAKIHRRLLAIQPEPDDELTLLERLMDTEDTLHAERTRRRPAQEPPAHNQPS